MESTLSKGAGKKKWVFERWKFLHWERQRQGELYLKDSKHFAACFNWSTQNETRHYQACLQQQLLSQGFPFFFTAPQQSLVWDKIWISSILLSTFSVVSYMILTSFTDNIPFGVPYSAAKMGVQHIFTSED